MGNWEYKRKLTQDLENQDRSILVHGKKNTKLTKTELKLALEKVQKTPDTLIDAGLQSPAITKRVDSRYPQTVISDLGKKGITGKAQERVDRYYAALDPAGNEKTNLHVRGAGQAKNAPLAKNILSKTPGKGTIVEYHDGKPKVIGRFNNPAGPAVRGFELPGNKKRKRSKGLYT